MSLVYVIGILFEFALGGVWLVSGGVALVAYRDKWPRRKRCLAAFAGVNLVILGCWGLVALLAARDSNPWVVFEQTFGEKVPPGTAMIHGLQIHDESHIVELSFQTDRQTFGRIRPQELEKVPFAAAAFKMDGDWWQPASASSEVWKDKGEASGRADLSLSNTGTLMTWDPDGRVQYYQVIPNYDN